MSIRIRSNWILVMAVLGGCAHHRAVKVECDGTLRPINRPAQPNPPLAAPGLAPVDSVAHPAQTAAGGDAPRS